MATRSNANFLTSVKEDDGHHTRKNCCCKFLSNIVHLILAALCLIPAFLYALGVRKIVVFEHPSYTLPFLALVLPAVWPHLLLLLLFGSCSAVVAGLSDSRRPILAVDGYVGSYASSSAIF